MNTSLINRNTAKRMVSKYKASPAGSINPETSQMQPATEFVHYTFVQLFELLVSNGIVVGSDTVDNIIQNKSDFGIKLYFAQHADASDCPDNDSKYIGSNTIIIVNTVKKGSIWYDLPEAGSGIKEIQEYETAVSGSALDKSGKCPPECNSFSNSL